MLIQTKRTVEENEESKVGPGGVRGGEKGGAFLLDPSPFPYWIHSLVQLFDQLIDNNVICCELLRTQFWLGKFDANNCPTPTLPPSRPPPTAHRPSPVANFSELFDGWIPGKMTREHRRWPAVGGGAPAAPPVGRPAHSLRIFSSLVDRRLPAASNTE